MQCLVQTTYLLTHSRDANLGRKPFNLVTFLNAWVMLLSGPDTQYKAPVYLIGAEEGAPEKEA